LGQKGIPISLCDYSDPFLPVHQAQVLEILNSLSDLGASNMIYITTKINPGEHYLNKLAAWVKNNTNVKITVFVSLAPLKKGIESVSIPQRVALLKSLVKLGIPCCWYLRPLNETWYDEQLLYKLANELIPIVGKNILLSNLIMSQEIEDNLNIHQLPIPKWNKKEAGKKILLSEKFEQHIRNILDTLAEKTKTNIGPIMGHRLCGVNGHHHYSCQHCNKNDRFCQLFKKQLSDKRNIIKVTLL